MSCDIFNGGPAEEAVTRNVRQQSLDATPLSSGKEIWASKRPLDARQTRNLEHLCRLHCYSCTRVFIIPSPDRKKPENRHVSTETSGDHAIQAATAADAGAGSLQHHCAHAKPIPAAG